jgi:5'-methylthioadenosine phosphorylase
MPEKLALAIIGGSGLYNMTGLTDTTENEPDTPFGKPSAPIVVGTLAGQRVAFLARHGLGHHIMPTEVPYRANIYALKALGADRIVSINACGSLRQDYAPGSIVIPDQIFDYTKERIRTFFGEGLVAHIGVADPFCPDLSASLEAAVKETGATLHRGGAFIIIEGPRFSIGMTTAPEAFLAREAEMCYTVMAHVTDYDVWHVSEAPVTVEMVIRTLNQNTLIAQQAVHNLVKGLSAKRSCTCENALANALITNPTAVPANTHKKLDLLVKKYLH